MRSPFASNGHCRATEPGIHCSAPKYPDGLDNLFRQLAFGEPVENYVAAGYQQQHGRDHVGMRENPLQASRYLVLRQRQAQRERGYHKCHAQCVYEELASSVYERSGGERRAYQGDEDRQCATQRRGGVTETEEKVAALTALLLSKPGVNTMAVIMNVVNNTRADVMAKGVVKGVKMAGKKPADIVTVFRIPGSWEQEATAIMEQAGVEVLGRDVSLNEAARRAVERSQRAA